MLQRDIDMLVNILESYHFDKDAVYKSLGLLGDEALDKAAEQGITQAESSDDNKDSTETDTDLFSATTANGKKAATVLDAETALNDLIKGW